MRQVLHILSKPDDPLAAEIIARQRASAERQIQVFDLTQAQLDYRALLEAIFTADSIQVW